MSSNQVSTKQLYIGLVTYYGEYRHDTEPRVFASDAVEAEQLCRQWCTGMNQSQLSIQCFPYVNGFKC